MGRTPIIPAWTRTVGRLAAEEAEVMAQCASCTYRHPVDLAKVIAKRGPLYSLWNRRPPCPTRCGGTLTFEAGRPGSGSWRTLMRTDDPTETAHLHRIWKAERDAMRAESLALSWLLKRRRQRVKVQRAARELVERHGPAAAAQAELDLQLPGLSDAELTMRVEVYREVSRRVRTPSWADLDEAV